MKFLNKKYLPSALLLIAGLTIGWFWGGHQAQVKATNLTNKLFAQVKPVREPAGTYQFISPILTYDVPAATEFGRLQTIQSKLADAVNKNLGAKNADKISVYFRNFNSGNWVGVDENDTYTPASLFKVPVMMAYFHLAESVPEIGYKQLKFIQATLPSVQIVKPTESLVTGQTYAVGELVRRMVIYSDNDATNLLLNNLPSDDLTRIFTDLGIKLPATTTSQDFVSVKTYANFFRILYGSTYLSRKSSEDVLRLLSQTEFKEGIVKPLPASLVVAHKFGEFGLLENGQITSREFHDCGIVYYPAHPYLLCVMTKGSDLTKLEQAVQDVSQAAYQQVNSRFGGK